MPEMNAVKGRKRNSFLNVVGFTLAVIVIVTPFRWFVAQPFLVSGTSMEPTIEANEYLIVDKLDYRFDEPRRGDVIVFKYPLDTSIYFIKRVIGLPGETVVMRNGRVIIRSPDGSSRALDEPYVVRDYSTKGSSTTTLAADEYFLLGDNRDVSSDSRTWGPLPKKYIIGRALISLFPLNRISLLPGAYALE